MDFPIINDRDDLDALEGTVEHAEFMTLLEGSMWLILRDDVNRRFVAIEDDTVISRFGFVRADFPNAVPPELPVWTPPPSDVPQSVSPLQAQLALMEVGKLDEIETFLNNPETDLRIRLAWNKASEFRRDSPTLLAVTDVLGWGSSDVDALFVQAAAIQV